MVISKKKDPDEKLMRVSTDFAVPKHDKTYLPFYYSISMNLIALISASIVLIVNIDIILKRILKVILSH